MGFCAVVCENFVQLLLKVTSHDPACFNNLIDVRQYGLHLSGVMRWCFIPSHSSYCFHSDDVKGGPNSVTIRFTIPFYFKHTHCCTSICVTYMSHEWFSVIHINEQQEHCTTIGRAVVVKAYTMFPVTPL